MYESCHTPEYGMSRAPVASAPHDKYVRHVARRNESSRAYEYVMSHMYKSCHTHEHGMSRVPVASAPHDKYMSHVAHANEPCRT